MHPSVGDTRLGLLAMTSSYKYTLFRLNRYPPIECEADFACK